jgi:hypothetical protein
MMTKLNRNMQQWDKIWLSSTYGVFNTKTNWLSTAVLYTTWLENDSPYTAATEGWPTDGVDSWGFPISAYYCVPKAWIEKPKTVVTIEGYYVTTISNRVNRMVRRLERNTSNYVEGGSIAVRGSRGGDRSMDSLPWPPYKYRTRLLPELYYCNLLIYESVSYT